MSEANIRAAIYSILSGVTDIGKVYDYERWAADWSKFISLFKTTIGGVEQIRGWEISRRSAHERVFTMGLNERNHGFVIRGYMRVNDAAASEKTFNTLIEAIADAFRPRLTLNGAAQSHDYIQAEPIEFRSFGSVLCHYAELFLTVYEEKDNSDVPGFLPADVPGLILDHDSQLEITRDGDNKISAWGDQAEDIGQSTQPTDASKPIFEEDAINGFPAVTFNGSSQWLINNAIADRLNGSDKPYTLFVVLQTRPVASAEQQTIGLGHSSLSPPFIQMLRFDTLKKFNLTRRDDSNNIANKYAMVGFPDWDANYIFAEKFNGTQIWAYINGVVDPNINGASYNIGTITLDLGTIGAIRSGGVLTMFAKSKIAKILLFDNAVSDENCQKLWDHLKSKYRI